MATITKKELVGRIAENTKVSRSSVKAIVQCLLDEITAELAKDNRLEFRGFAVFELRERAERMAQNPKTLEPAHVPARKAVKFKMGRLMREKLSKVITE